MRNLLRRWRRTRIYRSGDCPGALPKHLNWDRAEKNRQSNERPVVKGASKRVVVIQSPDPQVFEQALFIVREDVAKGRLEILREAQTVADRYVKGAIHRPESRFRRWLPLLIAALLLAILIAVGLTFRDVWMNP